VALLVALDAVALAPAVAAPTAQLPATSALLAVPGDSLETPGETDRVSLETDGSQTTQPSGSADISADGRYVVYREALADPSGLDLGRIMLRDRVAGTTTEVARGAVVVGAAFVASVVSAPAISGDGRWVAFVSGNPDPAAGARTVRLWDRTTGTLSSPLGQINGWADQPALSGDGRYLAFRTRAALAATDTNEFADVYVLDRQSGSVDLVSVATSGRIGARGDSGEPAISSDGRRVAFTSSALFLVSASVPAGQTQVYLRDRSARTTVLVSAGPGGAAGTGSSSHPSVSANGSVVAFQSAAADLVAGDTNGALDVFTWTARGGTVTRVSVSSGGDQGNGPSAQPSITGDGSQVAFASGASNLVPDDTNGATGLATRQGGFDIFVHSLSSGRTTRISVGPGPVQANGSSVAPSADGDGAVIAFESDAANLVAGDTNQLRDVFVRVRPSGLAVSPNPVDFGVVGGGGPPAKPRTVTITSSGVMPVAVQAVSITGPAAASFAILSDKCAGLRLAPGAACAVVVGVAPTATGQLTAQLQVADSAPGSPHTTTLTGLVLGTSQAVPKIVLSPTLGPTGTVVAVTGSGFAAGQPVVFAWSAGITPQQLAPTVAAPDGTFVAQVLVLPHDLLGPRTLSATSVVSGTPGQPATAPFLVVPQTAQPPSSPFVRIAVKGIDRPLIYRR
jgi:Tol biopolymer transport system component